ncbi:MAG: hypothetical protein ACI8RZ_003791 [Myxococcota bacterium]|jgi:hypothetical protein
MRVVYRWEADVRMILLTMVGCGGGTTDDDDDGGGLILGDDSNAPSMEDCASWLADSQADSLPHECSTDEYRNHLLATGGAVFPVGDGRYYTAWFPLDWDGQTVIYAVHGSMGCADMMTDLFTAASLGSYAVLSVQFRTEGAEDYDDADTLYDNLTALHQEAATHCPIEVATGVYYGYSRGGARGYDIAAIDAVGAGLFDAVVIDSGTSNLSQLAGWDTESLSGERLWLWCGSRDIAPTDSSRTTCDVMSEDMAPWVTDHAGTLDALVEEEGGCHGIFFGDCDVDCNCKRRNTDDLGESLPMLFDYIDGL